VGIALQLAEADPAQNIAIAVLMDLDLEEMAPLVGENSGVGEAVLWAENYRRVNFLRPVDT
jgi:hypothetical protein